MRSRVLFALVLFLSPAAFARISCLESIRSSLEQSYLPYTRQGCYYKNQCQIGVYLFVKKHKELFESVPNTKVLVLRHREQNQPIWHRPSLTRDNFGIPWSHHVLMMIDGWIYDMDYKNSPELVAIDEYFETFYLNLEDIDITPMSFEEYIRFFENRLSMDEALRRLRYRVPYSQFRDQHPIGP